MQFTRGLLNSAMKNQAIPSCPFEFFSGEGYEVTGSIDTFMFAINGSPIQLI